MHKASRAVINPQWVMFGILWRGGRWGHKDDHKAREGGGCHSPQSIVGHLTPAWVSATPAQWNHTVG